eukprot:g16498.t1
MELEQRDAEAEALCHGMTERLQLLHEERAVLSSELRELSARGRALSSGRLLAADNAVAAMATAGLAGVFAGVAAARFLAARRTSRLNRRGYGGCTSVLGPPPPKAPSS